jgi:hypothetical protein
MAAGGGQLGLRRLVNQNVRHRSQQEPLLLCGRCCCVVDSCRKRATNAIPSAATTKDFP